MTGFSHFTCFIASFGRAKLATSSIRFKCKVYVSHFGQVEQALAHEYSSESMQHELSKEYQHDRV